MKWEKCVLENAVPDGEDRLGNPLVRDEPVKETLCRFTPWTDEQIALEDREVTRNEQQFAIPVSPDRLPDCTHLSRNGVRQEIAEAVSLPPRYTVLRVKVYKG